MPINRDHFVYHAPTAETVPKYAAIRAAERACHALATRVGHISYSASDADYQQVNEALLSFAEVIDANAPDGDDKTAAIRCVRLARNAMNEELASNIGGFPMGIDCLAEAHRQLVLARWQANSAIACGGK